MLADKECPQICAFRGAMEYVSAAHSIGWDLAHGHLFPVVLPDGHRGGVAFSAPRMVTALQGHLRTAGLPSNFTRHSSRSGGSLSKSLAGTPMDEIMEIGGWKTVSMARYYILGLPPVRDYQRRSGNGSRPVSTRSTSRCPPEFERDFSCLLTEVFRQVT